MMNPSERYHLLGVENEDDVDLTNYQLTFISTSRNDVVPTFGFSRKSLSASVRFEFSAFDR